MLNSNLSIENSSHSGWQVTCGQGTERWVGLVSEKTVESPLDCKEIQPVHSKGNRPWAFFGRTDAEAETPILWLPHVKCWLIGKDSDAGRDWGQQEKGTTEHEMAWWHHRLDGRESQWTPGVGVGQGGLACYDSWGRKESDTTNRLIWSDTSIASEIKRWSWRMKGHCSLVVPSDLPHKGKWKRED